MTKSANEMNYNAVDTKNATMSNLLVEMRMISIMNRSTEDGGGIEVNGYVITIVVRSHAPPKLEVLLRAQCNTLIVPYYA